MLQVHYLYISVLEIGVVALGTRCRLIASLYWKDIHEFQEIGSSVSKTHVENLALAVFCLLFGALSHD